MSFCALALLRPPGARGARAGSAVRSAAAAQAESAASEAAASRSESTVHVASRLELCCPIKTAAARATAAEARSNLLNMAAAGFTAVLGRTSPRAARDTIW